MSSTKGLSTKNSTTFASHPKNSSPETFSLYLKLSSAPLPKVSIPVDLSPWVQQTQKVRRFADTRYQVKGMIPDNTKEHTIRCVYIAQMRFPENKILQRLLWLHDIPEIIADEDTNAVDRYTHPDVADAVEDPEHVFAKENFTAEDLSLYENFLAAEKYLSGRSEKLPKIQDALLAKVIDVAEGNLVYNYYFVNWLKTHIYNGKVPPTSVFNYQPNFCSDVLSLLRTKEINEGIRISIKGLIKGWLYTTLFIWEQLPNNRLPEGMSSVLVKTKDMLEKLQS